MRGLMRGDGEEAPGKRCEDTAELHLAYLASLRRHRDLMDDLCDTLEQFDRALEASGLPPADRSLITKNLNRHIDQARAIIADMDRALARAPAAPPRHPQ